MGATSSTPASRWRRSTRCCLRMRTMGRGAPTRCPAPSAVTISRPGDLWQLGRHRLLQGDARDPASYERLMRPGELARMIFCDPPYNVKVVNNVTSNAAHREFACASGEMAPEEFAQFLRVALGAPLPYLLDGGVVAPFIDWRSVHVLIGCGLDLGLDLLNLVVWQKTNGGQGSLWRSQHELLPVFKKGSAAPTNNVMLGKYGRWRSNVWSYPGGSSLGSEAREEIGWSSHSETGGDARGRFARCQRSRRDRHRPLRRLGLDPDRRGGDGPGLSGDRDRTRSIATSSFAAGRSAPARPRSASRTA